MSEIANGAYKYDFSSCDSAKDYLILTDGGATLSDADRYHEDVIGPWNSTLIVSRLRNGGAPATGLSPTISIIDLSDDSHVVTSATMSEVAGGAYKYDFTAQEDGKEYVVLVDGTATLSNVDRYQEGAIPPWRSTRVIYSDEISLENDLPSITLNASTIERELNVQSEEVLSEINQVEIESNIKKIDLDIEVN